jgi:capsule polysaccharide export protein KpsE/RkpR
MEERREGERALSERESELARLRGELDERSALANAQKNEIIALNTEVESLKEGLDAARTATQNLLKAEREKLQAALELVHRPRRRMKVPPNRARKRR